MTEIGSTARRFYDGFAARDPVAMLAVLHDDFVGHVSAGMPLGVGGSYRGKEQMLSEVWAPVFTIYEAGPVPDEFLVCKPDRVVAVGSYRGRIRESGAEMVAAFAHILRVRDELICELIQITDTASWPVPGA